MAFVSVQKMTNSGPIWLLFLLIAFMHSDMQGGWTALMDAAANDKCDVVTELISLGADVDIQDKVSYIFPMSPHDTTKWFRTTKCINDNH